MIPGVAIAHLHGICDDNAFLESIRATLKTD